MKNLSPSHTTKEGWIAIRAYTPEKAMQVLEYAAAVGLRISIIDRHSHIPEEDATTIVFKRLKKRHYNQINEHFGIKDDNPGVDVDYDPKSA